jgi:hypothetical protein
MNASHSDANFASAGKLTMDGLYGCKADKFGQGRRGKRNYIVM